MSGQTGMLSINHVMQYVSYIQHRKELKHGILDTENLSLMNGMNKMLKNYYYNKTYNIVFELV